MRSARSSARDSRDDSRSARAEDSSGESAAEVRERMRRYEVKRGRVDCSWERTSLLFHSQYRRVFERKTYMDILLDLEEGVLLVRGGHHPARCLLRINYYFFVAKRPVRF